MPSRKTVCCTVAFALLLAAFIAQVLASGVGLKKTDQKELSGDWAVVLALHSVALFTACQLCG